MSVERPNPFATRFTRPGAMPFLFLQKGDSAELLLRRLRDAKWRGQILGPHGSGKSTLLESLREPLEEAGRTWVQVALHDGQRRLPPGFPPIEKLNARALLVVDGYEQLGWPARWRLAWLCWRHRCGLLVTAHADVGLPEIYRTQSSLELARLLVGRLAAKGDAVPDAATVAAAFERHAGNLREVFFDLYDAAAK